jgi:hypothetical protein
MTAAKIRLSAAIWPTLRELCTPKERPPEGSLIAPGCAFKTRTQNNYDAFPFPRTLVIFPFSFAWRIRAFCPKIGLSGGALRRSEPLLIG